MVSELSSLKTSVRHELHEIASHAYNLAMGLQNTAPPQEGSIPSASIQYLLDTAVQLKKIIQQIDELA